MLALVAAPANLIFVCALVLMLLIGVVQAFGLAGDFGADLHAGADADLPLDLHVDVHADLHADAGDVGDLLGWLGFGRLPLLMLLVVFLGAFSALGLLGQQLAHDLLGAYQSGWLAAPAAFALALPATGLAARVLARVLPHDETSAVELDTLTGRPARIVTGEARLGWPARARVEDRFGQPHYVMVEPNSPAERFAEGETVLLVRREADRFRAISRGDQLLPRLEG